VGEARRPVRHPLTAFRQAVPTRVRIPVNGMDAPLTAYLRLTATSHH
jgi:hypothetical protein